MTDLVAELSEPIAAVILGAGKGTRMKSDHPKVMHKLAGRSMLGHVIDALDALAPDEIVVVVGPDMPQVAKEADPHRTVEQTERLGTAHAALCAKSALKGFQGTLVILFGDTPMLTGDALCNLALASEESDLVIAAFEPNDPARYGRVKLDDNGQLQAIVEFKDADLEEREIGLCNGGIMAGDAQKLWSWLERVDNNNKAREYYLPDVVKFAVADKARCDVVYFDEVDVMGINSRLELANAEAMMQDRLRDVALEAGVTMIDPSTTYLAWDTRFGRDVIVEPGCFFGPGVEVGSNVHIKAMSHLDGCCIADDCQIGPFARLRPGSDLAQGARIGNFVETKNAKIGQGSKVNHLSYVGDALVGQGVNVGAGTITCNYDGYLKYTTQIEDGAFIGSNSALVAPIKIGANALVAAGSTLEKDVPAEAIAVERAETRQLAGAETRRRTKMAAKKAAQKQKSAK